MNEPKELENRRKELQARLRDEPSKPAKPQWTQEEMTAAARRLLHRVMVAHGRTPTKFPVS